MASRLDTPKPANEGARSESLGKWVSTVLLQLPNLTRQWGVVPVVGLAITALVALTIYMAKNDNIWGLVVVALAAIAATLLCEIRKPKDHHH